MRHTAMSFVKGFYRRPLSLDGQSKPDGERPPQASETGAA
jgi:hypothetical protein